MYRNKFFMEKYLYTQSFFIPCIKFHVSNTETKFCCIWSHHIKHTGWTCIRLWPSSWMVSRNIGKRMVQNYSRFKDYKCVKTSLVKVIFSAYRYTKPQGKLILKCIKVSGKFNELLLAVSLVSWTTSVEFCANFFTVNSWGINAENLTHTVCRFIFNPFKHRFYVTHYILNSYLTVNDLLSSLQDPSS